LIVRRDDIDFESIAIYPIQTSVMHDAATTDVLLYNPGKARIMEVAYSVQGVPIRLTPERWFHNGSDSS
jgi:hypothetical protein